ncbi:ArsR/SmtB family transcription factor [Chloroflexota bacterium]
MRQLIKCFKALSDESRIRVLNLILERECCVCEVMQVMEISQSKASRVLSALHDAGLLRFRKEGRWVLYSINRNEMQDYMNEILAGVTRWLEGNEIAAQDLKKLKNAERVGPECVNKGCRVNVLPQTS